MSKWNSAEQIMERHFAKSFIEWLDVINNDGTSCLFIHECFMKVENIYCLTGSPKAGLTLSGFSSGGSGQDDTSAKATLRRESNRGMARSEFTTPDRESWSLTSNKVSSTEWSYNREDMTL